MTTHLSFANRRPEIRLSPFFEGKVRNRGFTLFELLVVLAIMSILAAVMFPKVNLHQFRIDAGVRSTQGALMQAERYAVQRQHDMIVSFDVPGKRLLLIDDQNNNSATDVGEKVMVRPLEDGVRFAIPPAAIGVGAVSAVSGTNLVSIAGYPSIVFHRDGATSTDLQVYITSTRPDATDFKGLTVTQSTGHVDYYSYRTKSWKRGGA